MDKKISYPIDETLSDVVNKTCPILHVIKIIDSKWKLPILWYLHEKENTRFNELQRRVTGITQFMLTKSLRELERDGLVCRRICKENPPKEVKYSLTEFGKTLMPAMNELYDWGFNHMQLSSQRELSILNK